MKPLPASEEQDDCPELIEDDDEHSDCECASHCRKKLPKRPLPASELQEAAAPIYTFPDKKVRIVRMQPNPASEEQDEEKVVMKEEDAEMLSKGKFDTQKFKETQKKKIDKIVNKGKQLTNLRRSHPLVIKKAAEACAACKVSCRCCSGINFRIIRYIRSVLYGPGTTTKARKKLICSWLLEIIKHNEMAVNLKGSKFDDKSRLSEWFVYDLSFDDFSLGSNENISVKRIDCCRSCFMKATGVSNWSINTWLKELRRPGGSILALEESVTSRITQLSPERMMVHAWLEMFVNEQACKSPDEHKHELPAGGNLTNIYGYFCAAWKEGVLNGSSWRKHPSRRKKKKKPDSVPKEVNVDEDGNEEPSDKEKQLDITANDPPSYQFFCRVWKKDFDGAYKIPRSHRRFAQCNWCSEIKNNLKYAKDEKKLFWKQALYDHYAWITAQREKYYKHRNKGIQRKHK